MISREKVITGLRYCSDPHTTVCYECPYHDEFMGCSVLAREALELLNEQEPVSVYESEISKCVCGEILNRYLYPNFCGNCGRKLIWHYNRSGNRMPDREKTIRGLYQHCKGSMFDRCGECPYYDVEDHEPFQCRDELLHDALKLLKEQDWNLITEDSDGFLHGLPGDDGQYLMTDGKDIWIDDYVDGVDDGIILDSGKDIREIVAWMNMPELPKLNRR